MSTEAFSVSWLYHEAAGLLSIHEAFRDGVRSQDLITEGWEEEGGQGERMREEKRSRIPHTDCQSLMTITFNTSYYSTQEYKSTMLRLHTSHTQPYTSTQQQQDVKNEKMQTQHPALFKAACA